MDQVEKLCDAIALIHNGNLVLSGTMREIKARYPRNRVEMLFEGDTGFLQHPSIEVAKTYSGQAEIKLHTSTASLPTRSRCLPMPSSAAPASPASK